MAFSIRNLKIRDQILLVTLPPLFVLLSAVALFAYAYWTAIYTEHSANETKESVIRGESFLHNNTDATTALRKYIFTRKADALAEYEKAMAAGQSDLITLRALESSNSAELQTVLQIQAGFDNFQRQWAFPLIARARKGEKIEIAETLADGQDRMATIRTQILNLQVQDEKGNTSAIVASEKLIRRMLVVGVCVAVILAGVGVLVTLLVTRQIVMPLRQLIRAAEQVARGDFSPALPPAANNEFGVLSRSFSQMTIALQREREEIASLNRFSESVTQSTSEVEVYDLLLHALKERFQPRQVVILQLKHSESYLEVAASLVPLPENVAKWPVIEERNSCKAVRSGRPFVVNDVRNEPLCPSKFILPSEGSYYCGPLIAGGIIIGAVRMDTAKGLWTPERQHLVESYLNGAAASLSNLRLLEGMKQQANKDALTGLYNRRFLEDYARKLFAIAGRREQPVGVMMLDLDNFKDFNDVYGHEMGDHILRQFAKTILASMRETNLAARYGGEEFTIILPDTDTKSCLLVAERIRHAVSAIVVPSRTDQPTPHLTVSIGVAAFPTNGRTLEDVIHASDKALYESKHRGRNCVTAAPLSETAVS